MAHKANHRTICASIGQLGILIYHARSVAGQLPKYGSGSAGRTFVPFANRSSQTRKISKEIGEGNN
jgi:hypothetical protein